MIPKLLIDPMEDRRLTNVHVSYEVWHYMVTLEWSVINTMIGFSFDRDEEAYAKGYTPKRYINEAYSSAVMTIIDSQPEFLRWLNKHANKPSELNELTHGRVGSQIRVGKDKEGWLLQVFWLGACIGAMRFDRKAPAPPGWREA